MVVCVCVWRVGSFFFLRSKVIETATDLFKQYGKDAKEEAKQVLQDQIETDLTTAIGILGASQAATRKLKPQETRMEAIQQHKAFWQENITAIPEAIEAFLAKAVG